ncbi:MAG: hypothetical protein GYB65_00520 [Chloroflexi bacterium]|nr:hypothetical protein [Chloroflexota bacterium]
MHFQTFLGLVLLVALIVVLPIAMIVRIIIRRRSRNRLRSTLEPEETLALGKPGPFGVSTWVVAIHPDEVVFRPQDSSAKSITVPREQARYHIELPLMPLIDLPFSPIRKVEMVATDWDQKHRLEIDRKTAQKLHKWMPPRTAFNLKRDLQRAGRALIVVGILHLLLAGILNGIWGVMLIAVGILNLVILHRNMFLLNGSTILIASANNFLVAFVLAERGVACLVIFAALQVFWGIVELRRARLYPAEVSAEEATRPAHSSLPPHLAGLLDNLSLPDTDGPSEQVDSSAKD